MLSMRVVIRGPFFGSHLPAMCPHCAMGQIVLQNIRRAVLTEAVRFWCHGCMSSRHMDMVLWWWPVCVDKFCVFVVVFHVAFLLDRADMLRHHSFAVRVDHEIGRWTRRAGCVWCRMCPRYQRSAP